MDLAIGASQVFVMMTLFSGDGQPKLVPECTYPLTGLNCVSRVYTEAEAATFLLDGQAIRVRDTFGVSLRDLQESVSVRLGSLED